MPVNLAGYNNYRTNSEYTCTSTQYINRTGCWCKKDREGDQCENQVSTECTIQITDPDFTKPCRNGSYDSGYYTYSNHGYDP